jgi:hypothetical protein
MPIKFKIATGEPSHYAFMCGYIAQRETPAKRVTMWHEGIVWHVRAHDFENHRRLFWDTYTSLSDARKRYRTAQREVFG